MSGAFLTRALLLTSLFLPASLLAGCGGDDPGGQDAGTPTLEPLVEMAYLVGEAEGGAWDSFSRVGMVTFDEDGNLYILDANAHRVSVVDPQGEVVLQFGNRGEGPGELRVPRGLVVLPDGEVGVADAGHRGFLIFGPEGEHRRTIRLPEGAMVDGNLLLPHLGDGAVFASRAFTITSEGGRMSVPTEIPIRRVALVSGDDDGAEASVLHEAWLPPRDMGEERTMTGPAGTLRLAGRTMRAFEPQLHLAVLPDGRIAVADSSTYRIEILGPDGEPAGVVERPIPPRVLTEREREEERQRRLDELDEGGGPQFQLVSGGVTLDQGDMREMLQEQVQEMEFWPEIPVIRRLAADREGRLWVGRSGAPNQPGPIDILTPEGEVVGSIPADAMAFPDAFGPDGLAAWIELDELEVARVRVGRVRGVG
ncbi:MAG: hypothetical protein WD960_01275 [Gemmatimonadota bacterium]